MALKRISDYSVASLPLSGSEMLEVETSSGLARKVSAQDIADLGGGSAPVASFVGCRATRPSTFTGSSTSTAISFDTNVVDTSSIHSASVNPTRFTVPSGMGGIWRVDYTASQTGGSSGVTLLFVRKNGGGDENNIVGSGSAINGAIQSAGNNFLVTLAAGDYLELFCYSPGGAQLGLTADTGRATNFELVLASGPAPSPSSTPVSVQAAVSDEGTALTPGARKLTFRMPYGMTLSSIRASLTTAASTGVTTADVMMNGASVLSTKVTIDATEKTSVTAATPPVISTSVLSDDAEITVDITTVGSGATGLKVTLIGTKA